MLFGVEGFALEIHAVAGRDHAVALSLAVRVIPGAHQDRSLWTDDPLSS